MLENIEGAIKNGQSRETGNKVNTRRRKTKQKHHYTQTNTNNVNKTWHTTRGKTNRISFLSGNRKRLKVKKKLDLCMPSHSTCTLSVSVIHIMMPPQKNWRK
jgi:hypothetical protein